VIVDTSALLSILQQESDAERFARALAVNPGSQMSAANWLEASMILYVRQEDQGIRDLDGLVAHYAIEVVEVTTAQAKAARRAFMKYGKGVHPARLNFGDCFAYALAKDSGEPLLFKGGDFAQTDVPAVTY
jgi:ribonuclease VapC